MHRLMLIELFYIMSFIGTTLIPTHHFPTLLGLIFHWDRFKQNHLGICFFWFWDFLIKVVFNDNLLSFSLLLFNNDLNRLGLRLSFLWFFFDHPGSSLFRIFFLISWPEWGNWFWRQNFSKLDKYPFILFGKRALASNRMLSLQMLNQVLCEIKLFSTVYAFEKQIPLALSL